MIIQVIDTSRGRRFLWADKDHMGKPLELTAEQMRAPDICQFESMEIRRNGTLWVPKGEIRWTGTHSSCPSFCNLGQLGQYRQQLKADEFKDGDEILISPATNKKPMPYFERLYWSSMMGLDYAPTTELYHEN